MPRDIRLYTVSHASFAEKLVCVTKNGNTAYFLDWDVVKPSLSDEGSAAILHDLGNNWAFLELLYDLTGQWLDLDYLSITDSVLNLLIERVETHETSHREDLPSLKQTLSSCRATVDFTSFLLLCNRT